VEPSISFSRGARQSARLSLSSLLQLPSVVQRLVVECVPVAAAIELAAELEVASKLSFDPAPESMAEVSACHQLFQSRP